MFSAPSFCCDLKDNFTGNATEYCMADVPSQPHANPTASGGCRQPEKKTMLQPTCWGFYVMALGVAAFANWFR